MAAVAGDLYQVSGKEGLTEMVNYFVPPLAREIGDDGAPQEVRDLSQEVAEIIKGSAVFLYSCCLFVLIDLEWIEFIVGCL